MGWRDYSLSTYEGNMVSGDMTAFLSGLSEEDRYIFEERAAIMEFEAGLTRAESEKKGPGQANHSFKGQGGKREGND